VNGNGRVGLANLCMDNDRGGGRFSLGDGFPLLLGRSTGRRQGQRWREVLLKLASRGVGGDGVSTKTTGTVEEGVGEIDCLYSLLRNSET